MNSTIEFLKKRRSVRKYKQSPLTREEIEAILQAAMRAPTAGNMMLYSIIEVEDQSIKDQLAVICDNQPFIATAPYVLLFVADYQRWADLFLFSEADKTYRDKGFEPRLPEEGELMMACCDALIAAQTAVIAAESMGIGSCYIGDILENCETQRELFNLPRYCLPVTLVCFGHPPVPGTESRLTRRFDRQYIVFRDRYQRLNNGDLVEMVRLTAEHQFPGIPTGQAAIALAKAMYTRKFASDFSLEMSRSVREWIKTWTGRG